MILTTIWSSTQSSTIEQLASWITVIGGPIAAALAIIQLINIRKELTRHPKLIVGYKEPGTAGFQLDNKIVKILRETKSGNNTISFPITIMNLGNKTARSVAINLFVPLPLEFEHGGKYEYMHQMIALDHSQKTDINPHEDAKINPVIKIPANYSNKSFNLFARVTMEDYEKLEFQIKVIIRNNV